MEELLTATTGAMDELKTRLVATISDEARLKVADVWAHANIAATQTGTNKYTSLSAATGRLHMLLSWLAGVEVEGQTGVVRDAREQLYRKASEVYWPLVPEQFRKQDNPEPTEDAIQRFRSAATASSDPYLKLRKAIKSAEQHLITMSNFGLGDPGVQSRLESWRSAFSGDIQRAVASLIGDAAEEAKAQASRDMIDPRYIDDTPPE